MYEATLREMVRKRPVTIVTESGSIILKSLRAAPWNQYQAEYKAMKRAKRPKLQNGNPDLFAE